MPDLRVAEAAVADPSEADAATLDRSEADAAIRGPSSTAAATQDLSMTVAATALHSSILNETLRSTGTAMARALLRTGQEAAYSAK
jgi:hypothetical protein